MKVVRDGNNTLGILFSSSELEDGLHFLTKEESFLQVGTWRYESGKQLLPHVHNKSVYRTIDRTQEVIHVIQGCLRARIFSEEEREVDSFEMRGGDTLILLGGGHGYDILENDTRVLEIKNGPYVGPEIDRRRIGART